MQSILNLLLKYNHWFIFLILEGISVALVLCFNNYQNAVFFTSANGVVGNIYSLITDVDGYFALKDENSTLARHNMELMEEVDALKSELAGYKDSISLANNPIANVNTQEYTFTTAKVVNSTINRANNFITIDKGSNDSIVTEMGVFNEQGVVGIVYQSSQNYSIIIPLLNSKSMISCRVKDNNSSCTLKWGGDDLQHSFLIDLPRYALFQPGDTVVTSGFSSIFPAGIPVGEIVNLEDSEDGMFFRAKVRLFVDFSSIDNLYLVGNRYKDEQKVLEQKINKGK